MELFGPIQDISVMVVIGPVHGPYLASLVDPTNFNEFVPMSSYLHAIEGHVPFPAPLGWIWFRTIIEGENHWFMLRVF